MDLVCFSHLNWDFVYQRPQHLLSRFTLQYRVFYIQEYYHNDMEDGYSIDRTEEDVWVVKPHLKNDSPGCPVDRQRAILKDLFEAEGISTCILWYYTPMSLLFSDHLEPVLTVYDCMDELSAFKFADPQLKDTEKLLFQKADIVFTGGNSLYESKKHQHPNVHSFPSSIEIEHFRRARYNRGEYMDQVNIPQPRLGFYGVIDERFDIELIEQAANLKPKWHFILVGPVVKIDPVILPRNNNIHYLGSKTYKELPGYLSGWDIALIPFAINESTRYISPTKTPEYLAAGKPVISTPIKDIIDSFGRRRLVHIVHNATELVEKAAIELELNRSDRADWLKQVDDYLATNSWDITWFRMRELIEKELYNKQYLTDEKEKYMFDYLIVGAGLAGSVLAERLATKANKKVLLIDKRNHIAGNTYDYYNNDGILVHKYGPHIFHTNSKDVFDYLGKFTDWRPYEHHVLASVDGQLVPIPINQNTINTLYGLNLSCGEVQEFLNSKAEKKDHIRTSEDVVVNAVGRELYEKFFKHYTRKQWDLDPSELDASVTARIPTRTNKDNRYFTDSYQAMPLYGYTNMFQKMLSHPDIKLMLNTDFKEVINSIQYKTLIYTGPIDAYFNYRFGKLPYRSIEFKFETIDTEKFQPAGTVNFPNSQPYTRITEFKHLTGQRHTKTSIVYEYPTAEGDPYYPIPRGENTEIYNKYKLLAASEPDTFFTGRLGTYKYYNMDQVVAQSLALFKKLMQSQPEPKVNGYKFSTIREG